MAWVLMLFAVNFFLQRLAVPGLSVPIVVPLTLLWLVLALHLRIVSLDDRRLLLWAVPAALSALVVIPQLLFVTAPIVSPLSWALWIVLWLPVVVHIRDRSIEQYQRLLRAIANLGVGISALSILFIALQFAGIAYRDWLNLLLPTAYLVPGYVTTYPVVYGSAIYKSNAWLALEPSFLSFTLGTCAVCAILMRMRPWTVLLLLLGLFSTASGSGFAVLAVAVVLMCLTKARRLLIRYVIPGLVAGAILAVTPIGADLLGRITEGRERGSSTSLRAIEPYLNLWPQWIGDPAAMLFGRGAGSSRRIIEGTGVSGLLVGNVPKVFFDYGLVAGALLMVLMIAIYVNSPEPILALSLGASMLILQPASPSLVMVSVALLSLWSPTLRNEPLLRPPRNALGQAGGRLTQVRRLHLASWPTLDSRRATPRRQFDELRRRQP